MKKVFFVFLVLFVVFTTQVNAQKGKYGHLNADSVLLKMPELQVADLQLKNFITEFENEIQTMNSKYEELVKTYNANEATMSDLIKQNKAGEIVELETRIKDFQVSAQEEVNSKRLSLYTPILDKFNNAVKEVAKENGYKMIFDNGKGILLYYDDEDDVTLLVEKKLGIK